MVKYKAGKKKIVRPKKKEFMKPIFLDVELRNEAGQTLLTHCSAGRDKELLKNIQEHISQNTGGLLCQQHFQVPITYPAFAHGRWVVRISSCCEAHLALLQERLNEIFTS